MRAITSDDVGAIGAYLIITLLIVSFMAFPAILIYQAATGTGIAAPQPVQQQQQPGVYFGINPLTGRPEMVIQ